MQAALPGKPTPSHTDSALNRTWTQTWVRTLPGRVALALAGTAFVAFCPHVSAPVLLPLRNFALPGSGMLLGAVAGFAAMVLYLAEDAYRLPGPSGVLRRLGSATTGIDRSARHRRRF